MTVKLLIFSQSRKYVIHNVSMITSFLYFLVEPSHESNNSLIMDYFVMSFFVCYKLSTYFAFIMLYAVFVQAIICLFTLFVKKISWLVFPIFNLIFLWSWLKILMLICCFLRLKFVSNFLIFPLSMKLYELNCIIKLLN